MVDELRDRLGGTWTLSVGLLEGWLKLPLRVELTDADVGSEEATAALRLWARETTDGLLGEDVDGRDELAHILRTHLHTAWEANPMFAGVFLPYPECGVEAVADVAPMSPELGVDLAEVRRVKGMKDGTLLAPRVFEDVELPLGPALLADEVFRPKGGGSDAVGQRIIYWCTVPQADAMVTFTTESNDLSISDDLIEQAELMAQSLEFIAL